ncbi:unnamed protein product [marine sediment metagenome]|uniref:Uncharacterized protein n=1 Tax=marine sediment metagenome TaxID=412755 RepID=X1RUW7_9ZZZZ
MTTFSQKVERKFLVKTAAKEIKKEIEQAGLDKLKELADLDISIVEIYLKSRSTQQEAKLRWQLNALLGMGVTFDMLLEEVARQMPELAPIMGGREGYKQSEIQNLERFLKEG